MNPSESTGQQQPELTASDKKRIEALAMSYAYLGKNYNGEILYDTKYYDGYLEGAKDAIKHERSLSRWKSIAVDGLPGEDKLESWFIFYYKELKWDERVMLWADWKNIYRHQISERYTHYFELPNT